ncbi:hypothetical protein [Promicromonospora soli]
MSKTVTNTVLVYEIPDLEVVGREEPTHVTVRFHRHGGEETFGLDPRDFPKVYTAPADSPHRYPDDALCLYYPLDPPWRRWRSSDGLDVLLTLVANHLFAEDYWSATGGTDGGQWVLDEAPHGIPARNSR